MSYVLSITATCERCKKQVTVTDGVEFRERHAIHGLFELAAEAGVDACVCCGEVFCRECMARHDAEVET